MKSQIKQLDEDKFQVLSVRSFKSEQNKSDTSKKDLVQRKQQSDKSEESSSLGSLFEDIGRKIQRYTNQNQPALDDIRSISIQNQSRKVSSLRRQLKDIDFRKDRRKSVKQYQASQVNQLNDSQNLNNESNDINNSSTQNLDQQRSTFDTISKPFQYGYFQGQNISSNSDFEDSISVDDGKSTIVSKRTILQNEISHKIIIIDNKKYQIFKPTIQLPNQSQIPLSQQQFIIDNKQDVISIDKFFNQDNCWDQLDKINRANSTNETTFMIYRQILNSELSVEDRKNHFIVRSKIVSESQKQKNSYFTILLALEEYIKNVNNHIQVIFCEKSSLKTQVSLKMISTGFAFHKFKCIEKISQKKFSTFQKIVKSQKKYKAFEDWYEQQVIQRYKVPLKSIKITSIFKLTDNRLGVEWDIYDPSLIYKNELAHRRIKVSPYFKRFYFSIEDFDTERGNISFPINQTRIFMRGNYPYYSPSNCSRFSIKVWNKYDSSNNEWLSMKNGPNEWASVFFGLYLPQASKLIKQTQYSSVSSSDTADQLQIPIQFLKNNLKETICINTKQKVGEGIICTPYMWNALRDAHEVQVNGQKYALVFQCRFNPSKIKITQKQEYWIINQFADIRPYGIILVKQSLKRQYPKPEVTFKCLFSYDQWKQSKQQEKKSPKQSTTKN